MKKLKRHDSIPAGSFHSVDGGRTKFPIHPETIGQTPADFSPDREFFAPIRDLPRVIEIPLAVLGFSLILFLIYLIAVGAGPFGP